jgi:hypothetical protein
MKVRELLAKLHASDTRISLEDDNRIQIRASCGSLHRPHNAIGYQHQNLLRRFLTAAHYPSGWRNSYCVYEFGDLVSVRRTTRNRPDA